MEIARKKEILRTQLLEKRAQAKKQCSPFEWGPLQFEKSLTLLNQKGISLENSYVGLYYPIKEELSFLSVIKPHWLLPYHIPKTGELRWFRYGQGEFVKSSLGLPEVPYEETFRYEESMGPFICFVPGLAGSLKHQRLGYGRGYYDRFLSQNPSVISLLCLPNSDFVFEELPIDSFDAPVSFIIY
jgi:5,10-methenyltetrahydrofolate synthetase